MTSYTYLSKELSENTTNEEIKEAYNRNILTVTAINNKVYYISLEPWSDRLFTAVKNEMEKQHPEIIYLYDLPTKGARTR